MIVQPPRNPAARTALRELRSLGNVEKYLQAARAELASNPCDERLRAFIELIEGLLRHEKVKFGERNQFSNAVIREIMPA